VGDWEFAVDAGSEIQGLILNYGFTKELIRQGGEVRTAQDSESDRGFLFPRKTRMRQHSRRGRIEAIGRYYLLW
jgi:hypothetical protein